MSAGVITPSLEKGNHKDELNRILKIEAGKLSFVAFLGEPGGDLRPTGAEIKKNAQDEPGRLVTRGKPNWR